MNTTDSNTTQRRSFLAKLCGLIFGSAIFGAFNKSFAAPGNSPSISHPAAPSIPTEAYIGSIGLFAGNFAPSGWMLCNGASLSTGAYGTLFALIGYTYGGSGSNFNIPDLRGRVVLGAGTGTGLSARALGSNGGAETHALTSAQLPLHNHVAYGSSAVGTSDNPTGLLPAVSTEGSQLYAGTNPVALSASAISNTGSATNSHNNMQPFLTLNYCICVNGVWPTAS